MPGIFISYRRDDKVAALCARTLYDRLAEHFGEEHIFMDIDTLKAGTDFVRVIGETVKQCDALIAMIGDQWLEVRDEQGNRRLDSSEDWVRLEIASALKREIQVIPALVYGAAMPRSKDLPRPLKKLARRQAAKLTHEHFSHDMTRLLKDLSQLKRSEDEEPATQREQLGHQAKHEFRATESAVHGPHPNKRSEPGGIPTGTSDVFISYSRRQSEAIVRTLAKDIRALGHTVWLDQMLIGGQVWWEEILERVRTCSVFVFALAPEALDSEASKREYQYAADLGKPILPVLVADGVSTDLLPPALAAIQLVDYRGQDEDAVDHLERAINTILADSLPRPPEVPISYLVGLAEQVRASSLGFDEQSALVVKLKRSLSEPESTADARELLESLRKRRDLFAAIAEEIDELAPGDIVMDPDTGLMWTRADNGRDIEWDGADKYARNLKLAGYSDWRLPTIGELESIYDPNNVTGKWEGMYDDTGKYEEWHIHTIEGFRLTAPFVWGATIEGLARARCFDFYLGERKDFHLAESSALRALCVRLSGEQGAQ